MLGALHGAVPGCSFLVTNAAAARRTPEALRHANEFLQRRGPDATSQVERIGVLFVHNLLSLTGVRTTQPFVDEAHSTVALFNGEIYNWRELGVDGATTDGHVLLPMYRRRGLCDAPQWRVCNRRGGLCARSAHAVDGRVWHQALLRRK